MFDEKSDPQKPSIFSEILSLLSANFSQYFMFIALIVIMLIFTIATDGVFISSRNISNLLNQMGYIAVPVSYTHLRAHETVLDLVCRLLLEKKK